jgi:opacity protein-like surface antigen
LNSDPINVDGYLAEDKPVTDGELEQIRSEIRKQKNETQLNKQKTKGFKELSKSTEKLSETTEEYIDEKKSAQKEIADYNAKIKCLMDENPGKDCDKYIRRRNQESEVVQEVATGQAAPAQQVVAEVAPVKTGAPFETIKLLPYAGGTSYNGEVEQLEASMSAGLRLESNLSRRFSIGMGFNYSQLKTQDFANTNPFFMNQGWNSGYYNTYGMQGREINFRTMGLDFYGKFFITNNERFRPYLGAGVGYNQATMKYSENNPYQYNMNFFGNENYRSGHFRGSMMLGSEVMITENFGFNIEAAFATGLGDSVSSESARNVTNSPDQRRLQELGNDIINSNAISIFAGAVVSF